MVVKDGNHGESQQCGGTDTKQQRNGQTLKYGVQDDNEGATIKAAAVGVLVSFG